MHGGHWACPAPRSLYPSDGASRQGQDGLLVESGCLMRGWRGRCQRWGLTFRVLGSHSPPSGPCASRTLSVSAGPGREGAWCPGVLRRFCTCQAPRALASCQTQLTANVEKRQVFSVESWYQRAFSSRSPWL